MSAGTGTRLPSHPVADFPALGATVAGGLHPCCVGQGVWLEQVAWGALPPAERTRQPNVSRRRSLVFASLRSAWCLRCCLARLIPPRPHPKPKPAEDFAFGVDRVKREKKPKRKRCATC